MTKERVSSHSSSKSQEHARKPTKVRVDPLPEKSSQRKPDTDSLYEKCTSERTNSGENSNPQVTPIGADSANAKSSEVDHEIVSDIRDDTDGQEGSIEAPLDQPIGNDVESADDTECGLPDKALTEIESITRVSDNSGIPPAYPPEESVLEPGSQSEIAEDPRSPAHRNTDDGSSSPPDLSDLPTEPPKKTEARGANTLDEDSDSLDHQREQKKSEPSAPRRIGGRRNGPSQSPSPVKDMARDKPKFIPPPELICRQVSGSWQAVLYADDECNITEVCDGGKSLEMVKGECPLSSLSGHLSIKYADRDTEEFSLFDNTPLIFKLRNNWKGDGRKVGGITSGHFIIIVPREWRRIGPLPPVEPEECADTDFIAHYFCARKGETAGDIGRFEGYDLPLTASGFELIGKRVFDDSEDSELFVGVPPKLSFAPGIVWAMTGEEGKAGWRERFRPAIQPLEGVLNDRQGRFFVRVYRSGETHQYDNGEFRYFSGLQEIRVNDEPYTATSVILPSSRGHSETKLRFVRSDGDLLYPKLRTKETHATVQPEGTVLVKPHPNGDHLSCKLVSDEGSVDIVLNLPRIWWRLEQDNGSPVEWCDKPLEITRQDFRNFANVDAAIRLRMPPRIASVKVGFDEELDRVYRRNEEGAPIKIFLTDFLDYSQIGQGLYEDTSLNVQCGNVPLSLIRVVGDPLPEIISFTAEPAMVIAGETATLRWDTQNSPVGGVVVEPGIGPVELSGSQTVEPAETTVYTLRLKASGIDDMTRDVTVRVRSQPDEETLFARARRKDGGWRQGRGFSRGELRVAGLTAADAVRRSIRLDKRRRSMHLENIETIRRSMNA